MKISAEEELICSKYEDRCQFHVPIYLERLKRCESVIYLKMSCIVKVRFGRIILMYISTYDVHIRLYSNLCCRYPGTQTLMVWLRSAHRKIINTGK